MNKSQQILSEFIIHSKYAQYLPELTRRESWQEIVERNKQMHLKKFPFLKEELDRVYQLVLDKKIMPSMRSLQFAGKAIEKTNKRMYNCAFLHVNSLDAFKEIMDGLLCGNGFGYSVQKRHIDLLPDLNPNNESDVCVIGDSIEGWVEAIGELIGSYFGNNRKPVFDYSLIRAKGTRLKTSGGRAPGPEPLRRSLNEIQAILDFAVEHNSDKRLTSLQIHDIVCHIADAVVSGGIRRSACIVLFDKDDNEMMECKSSHIVPESISFTEKRKAIDKPKKVIDKIKLFFKRPIDYIFGAPERTVKCIANGRKYESSLFEGKKSNNLLFTDLYDYEHLKSSLQKECIFDTYSFLESLLSGYITSIRAFSRDYYKSDPFLQEFYNHGLYINNYSNFTLEWYRLEPQRARANNSVILLRGAVSEEEFKAILYKTRDSKAGEPGIYWTNDLDLGTNPCLPETVKLLTKKGLVQLAEIKVGDKVWTNNSWSEVTDKWVTGRKDVYKVVTEYGTIECTANHRVVSEYDSEGRAVKVEAISAKAIESFSFNLSAYNDRKPIKGYNPKTVHNPDTDIVAPFLQGYLLNNGKSYKDRYVCFSEKQLLEETGLNLVYTDDILRDYNSDICGVMAEGGFTTTIVDDKSVLSYPEWLDYQEGIGLPSRVFRAKSAHGCLADLIPNYTLKSLQYFVAGFLVNNIKFDSSGAIIAFKHVDNAIEIQTILNAIGIRAKLVIGELDKCELHITHSLEAMYGLFQNFNCKFVADLKEALELYSFKDNNANISSKVLYTEKVGEQEVWDITVDNATHTFWCNGLDISNCVEIGLSDCGFCNLSLANVADIESQEDLNERVKAAAFLGTLQASYTNFPELRPKWQQNAVEQALLGVGLSGIASGEILKYNIKEAASEAVKENERVASLIGINKAHRVTCIKPDGNSAVVLGVASGIHAYHAPYYLRRVRLNKEEPIYKYLKENLPALVEDCVFYPETTAVLTLPIEAPKNGIFRDEGALNFLEREKWFYEQWILPGHRNGANTHNISCTVNVKPHEWQPVIDWMWDNRDYYAGISLLDYSDPNYPQLPLEECTKEVYEEWFAKCQGIDLTQVIEEDDLTNHEQEAACAGGVCELQ